MRKSTRNLDRLSVAAAIRHFRDEFEWHVENPEECLRRNYGLMHYADPIKVGEPA